MFTEGDFSCKHGIRELSRVTNMKYKLSIGKPQWYN